MPLKTYLPDGDIDLTVICSANLENVVASAVRVVLKEQEVNGAAPFEVKDVHYIDAEVSQFTLPSKSNKERKKKK